jgi:hypothetical protein
VRHVNDTEGLKKGVHELFDMRRPVGIQILYSHRCPAMAFQLYEVLYSDGSSDVRRGQNLRTIHGFQDLNGTKAQKKKAAKSLRVDFEAPLIAAHILLERVSDALWDLDKPDGALPRNRTGTAAVRKRSSRPLNQKGKKR